MIRAKFECTSVSNDDMFGNEHVYLSAVYDNGKANKEWSEATPAGSLDMVISNPDAKGQFVAGKEYFLDFTPVEG